MPQIFVIHSHNATHHHCDLRLEIDGVLKSFAILKTPPTEPGIKRLANMDVLGFEVCVCAQTARSIVLRGEQQRIQ